MHRAYVLTIEKALQSIVPDVMMPYWDETSEETCKQGIPWVLTIEKFELDGEQIDNPLLSYTFPKKVNDSVMGDQNAYTKPVGYKTVRYPLSGLVGTEDARTKTEEHNRKFDNVETNTKLLNENVKAWLNGTPVTPEHPNPPDDGIYSFYEKCLHAPNYTVFSNTTSAHEWNKSVTGSPIIIPLEQPHNDIHLAIGGYDRTDSKGKEEVDGQLGGANGDMGENDTAALDPIFFFHHCYVDRVFWLWQKQNGHTDELEIIPKYPGTSSSDSQGPTPGIPKDTPLTLDTPLNPFLNSENNPNSVYTSKDCINIEKQLGYTYSEGSLQYLPKIVSVKPSTKKLSVTGIDRSLFSGSFIILAYAKIDGKETQEYYLGHHSVLSRWNVHLCANCQTHLEVVAHFDLSKIPEDLISDAEYFLKFQHRQSELPKGLTYNFKVVS